MFTAVDFLLCAAKSEDETLPIEGFRREWSVGTRRKSSSTIAGDVFQSLNRSASMAYPKFADVLGGVDGLNPRKHDQRSRSQRARPNHSLSFIFSTKISCEVQEVFV